MSDNEDTRILCKYGANCYQKNSAHHEKYKHPPKKRQLTPEKNEPLKRAKLISDSESEEDYRIDNASDSDEKETKEAEETPGQNMTESIETETQDRNEIVSQSQPLLTLEDKKQFIRDKYLVEMPEDFYAFWEFCKTVNKTNPKLAFNFVGLTLVGPYDILDDTFEHGVENDNWVLHWRYFYDPPEFQTVIKGKDNTGYHIGYFRDAPDKPPVFLGCNSANKDCTIEKMGENIFGAVNTYLEEQLKVADPYKKMNITRIHKQLQSKAKEHNFDISKLTPAMQRRHPKTVAKTFHTAGIVVPYERKTQLGYRKLPVNDKELRKLLESVTFAYPDKGTQAFTKLQPVLTAATIANDECDFGTALELGLDIFCYGKECFNNTILRLLNPTYMLLQRAAFSNILELHLKHREKGKPYVIKL